MKHRYWQILHPRPTSPAAAPTSNRRVSFPVLTASAVLNCSERQSVISEPARSTRLASRSIRHGNSIHPTQDRFAKCGAFRQLAAGSYREPAFPAVARSPAPDGMEAWSGCPFRSLDLVGGRKTCVQLRASAGCFPASRLRYLLALRFEPVSAHVPSTRTLPLCRTTSPDSWLVAGSRSVAAVAWPPTETQHRDPTGRKSLDPISWNPRPLAHCRPLLWQPSVSIPLTSRCLSPAPLVSERTKPQRG